MRFPEWLWQLLPGDTGTQQLGVIWREGSSTQNAAAVGVTVYTVPTDKCLVLTNAAVQLTPSAGVTVNRRRIMADPPEGTVRFNIHDEETQGAASAIVSQNWQGEVVVPGGWKVRVEGNFDAAGANNNVSGEIHGYLIPRGTFIFG